MFNPPHPGMTLRNDVLPALGLTVTQAAVQFDVSRVDDADEQSVDHRSLYPKGLNNIPDGKAGLRFLAALNALKPRQQLKSEDCEDRLVAFLE